MRRRRLYSPKNLRSPVKIAKQMAMTHNVTLTVFDQATMEPVQTHEGHNAATNTLLTGIGHYLIGDGIYNQAYDMLSRFVPRYISLGTMGLLNQDEDKDHLPAGLGGWGDSTGDTETQRLCDYISQCPGFGADGYDANENGGREYFGLGPRFDDPDRLKPLGSDVFVPVNCELVSDSFLRSEISFRDIVPEVNAEIPKTIDVVYSAMVSTGALAAFREPGRDYVFITEAGLWSKRKWSNSGENGLLAAYRIVPPSQTNWNFGTFHEAEYGEDGEIVEASHYEFDDDPEVARKQMENQMLLKKNVLRVGLNQVVQVTWKIQIGGLEQLGGMSELYPNLVNGLIWNFWD